MIPGETIYEFKEINEWMEELMDQLIDLGEKFIDDQYWINGVCDQIIEYLETHKTPKTDEHSKIDS